MKERDYIVNGMAVRSFEQMIAEAREAVLQATTDALDEQLERFLLPADKVALLWDFAKFACFLAALKVAETNTPLGRVMEKRDPLRAWHQIGKQIDKEVPAMLLEFGREAEAKHVEGTGEETHEV